MTAPQIHQPDPGTEYYFDEGCFILENWNTDADTDCSIARARLPAGGHTRWHALDATTERYLIIAGQGSVEVGDLPPTSVTTGAVVLIPAGVRQRIRNTGTGELVFYAICTPRFRPSNYRDLEA